MRNRLVLFLLLLAGAVTLPHEMRAQRQHPDLKSGKKTIHSAIIIPVQFSITKAGMKGSESMIAESEQVAGALPGMIAKALEEKGCKVLENPFTPAELEKNEELRYALGDIQKRYDAIQPQMIRKIKDIEKGRFTLGDEVTKVNPKGAADVLVFVRGFGYLATGGKKAFGLLVPGAAVQSDYAFVNISVVDGQNGSVLFYTGSYTGGNVVKNTESMSKSLVKAFKKFPGTTGSKKG